MFTEVTSHHHLFDENFHLAAKRINKVEHIRANASYDKIDIVSFQSAEIHALHSEVYNLVPNGLNTTLGSASLLASLISPPTDIAEIKARQIALNEIDTNESVRTFIENILKVFSSNEVSILNYISGNYSLPDARWQFGSLKKFIKELQKICSNIPQTDSTLLTQVFSELKNFKASEESKIVSGPTLCTIAGLRSKGQAKFLPRYHYRAAPFDFVSLSLIATYASVPLVGRIKDTTNIPMEILPLIHSLQSQDTKLLCALIGAFGMFFWPTAVKLMADDGFIHAPLGNRYRKSSEVSKTFGAVGLLGELYALHCFNKIDSPSKTTPVFHESDRFEFSTTNMHNPLAMVRGQNIVPNDFTLGDNRLVSIEGSNSGGKTFFCKGAFQTQLLAQLGANAFAESYTCSVAEHFFYQIVSSGTQDNDDGNFGSGLERAAYLLYKKNLNKKFFAVLDELAEGTTQPEKIETAGPVLHAFRILGAGILWANHNYELVEMMPSEIVDPWKIEIIDGAPTHKLVRGVSYSSGAKRVVQKHGLDPDSLRKYLSDNGFETPNKFIGEDWSTKHHQ